MKRSGGEKVDTVDSKSIAYMRGGSNPLQSKKILNFLIFSKSCFFIVSKISSWCFVFITNRALQAQNTSLNFVQGAPL